MKARSYFAFIAVFATALPGPQDASKPSQPQSTRFETFRAKRGNLQIREHYGVTAPKLEMGVWIEPTIIRTTLAADGQESFNLQLLLRKAGMNQVLASVVLDEEELASLFQALRHLQANRERTFAAAKTYLEQEYRSQSGFAVLLAYSPDTKKTTEAITIEREHGFLVEGIGAVLKMVEYVQARIEELRRK